VCSKHINQRLRAFGRSTLRRMDSWITIRRIIDRTDCNCIALGLIAIASRLNSDRRALQLIAPERIALRPRSGRSRRRPIVIQGSFARSWSDSVRANSDRPDRGQTAVRRIAICRIAVGSRPAGPRFSELRSDCGPTDRDRIAIEPRSDRYPADRDWTAIGSLLDCARVDSGWIGVHVVVIRSRSGQSRLACCRPGHCQSVVDRTAVRSLLGGSCSEHGRQGRCWIAIHRVVVGLIAVAWLLDGGLFNNDCADDLQPRSGGSRSG
jgi:hypothetical protein